jgi:ArsR family metal-binding transcriptional regulator
MKKLLLLSILSTLTFAQNKNVNIEEVKSRALSFMDKKITILQDGKSCVNSASSREELKSCRKNLKEKMKAFRTERKQAKSDRKKERIEKMKKKIAELEAQQNT